MKLKIIDDFLKCYRIINLKEICLDYLYLIVLVVLFFIFFFIKKILLSKFIIWLVLISWYLNIVLK